MASAGYYEGWTDPEVAQVMAGAGIVGALGGAGKGAVKAAARRSAIAHTTAAAVKARRRQLSVPVIGLA